MVFVVISTKGNPPTVWLEEQTPQPSVVCFVSCSLWNSWSTLKEKKEVIIAYQVNNSKEK